MRSGLAAVVLAAGLGTRMRSATPKHLQPWLGRRLVDWVIAAAVDAGSEQIVVVASRESAGLFDGVDVVVQEQPIGTGDALLAARAQLAGMTGDVLVLSGDAPLLRAPLLHDLVETHRRERATATVL